MPEERLELLDLYKFVLNFFGSRARGPAFNPETGEVTCILYDAFSFECGLDPQTNAFGAGIRIDGNQLTRHMLGRVPSLNSDLDSIRESLELVEEYVRLRLPDKYLEAFDRTHPSA